MAAQPASVAQAHADVIIIGAGLSGLVAASEVLDAGRTVILVDQENESNLGAQAWWSFGGLFMIDSPEQRRLGIKDSLELARSDWFASAGFDRESDFWGKQWAEAYLDFASGEKRAWLRERGVGFFPVVGWAERGGSTASGHGNSVPRFHITWGTGPGLVHPFASRLRQGIAEGKAKYRPRHRVTGLTQQSGTVTGVQGELLAADSSARGEASNREVIGEFEFSASSVIVATGGIGGNHELVRKNWPGHLPPAPAEMLSGVPAHVDGLMLGVAEQAGAAIVNSDRMWHYTEGITNHSPVWPKHGIRILPGPSSLWLDATGQRMPPPALPGFDTLGTLEEILKTGYDHSWFILTQRIIEKEFALSGSEQNPDLTGKSIPVLIKQRLGKGAPGPVQAFIDRGVDFLHAENLDELIEKMQANTDAPLDAQAVRTAVRERDLAYGNKFTKDLQLTAIRDARHYVGDKLIRVAPPHRLLDPKAGPLYAVKLHVLTRKSLGGLQTDLQGRVLDASGTIVNGLYAAGEASGFGGGGMHGYRALEGTFVGGCIFSGRAAGRAAAGAA
ncbi:FAD-binding dehydrogenase [Leucobacter sp. UT-8R-CII-1-4]|uniref:FAD-binding dehydrogenase n=1 Tax=Leucobacter sp. UT-8R-CII-1-4 TaxID=3040075 RepID=UPI0024A84AB8|nr:FAD-binding dehydrogenase [Leucobacter sp. UT-8R-CII-1-4]MDI6024184.1 FAD-binding dehydrogenase [Leucobacter sp. UT-8R-CII-1-4]